MTSSLQSNVCSQSSVIGAHRLCLRSHLRQWRQQQCSRYSPQQGNGELRVAYMRYQHHSTQGYPSASAQSIAAMFNETVPSGRLYQDEVGTIYGDGRTQWNQLALKMEGDYVRLHRVT